jgi:hypothetical protein
VARLGVQVRTDFASAIPAFPSKVKAILKKLSMDALGTKAQEAQVRASPFYGRSTWGSQAMPQLSSAQCPGNSSRAGQRIQLAKPYSPCGPCPVHAQIGADVEEAVSQLLTSMLKACEEMPEPWESPILRRAFCRELEKAVEFAVSRCAANTSQAMPLAASIRRWGSHQLPQPAAGARSALSGIHGGLQSCFTHQPHSQAVQRPHACSACHMQLQDQKDEAQGLAKKLLLVWPQQRGLDEALSLLEEELRTLCKTWGTTLMQQRQVHGCGLWGLRILHPLPAPQAPHGRRGGLRHLGRHAPSPCSTCKASQPQLALR